MPARNDGIICRECGGSGCPTCNQSGYAKSYHSEHHFKQTECWADLPIVPMPYGKMLPDLTDCYYVNEPEWNSYSGPILCPACGSDHIAGLSKKHNLECSVMGENLTPSDRWFCISCYDSWCYEREH